MKRCELSKTCWVWSIAMSADGRGRQQAHPNAALALLTEAAHFAGGDAAHDLGQREAALVAALAHATQQRPEQLALLRQAPLVLLGGQAAAEATLQVWAPARCGGVGGAHAAANRSRPGGADV